MLDVFAKALGEREPGALVRVAHMELTSPTIDEALAELVAGGAAEVVVYPHFLAPGRHIQVDLPALLRQAAARHPGLRLWLAEPLGTHPGLLDLMLDRIAEATPIGAKP